MKSFFVFTVLLFTLAIVNAQTKMYINKTTGTDSIALSDIKGISFKTVPTDRQILFQENFENDNLNNWLLFSTPVISSLHSVSPTHSLTLPSGRSDYCFIYKNLTDSITTGIVGLEYTIMKKDSTAKTVFYGLLYQKSATPSNAKMELVNGFGGSTISDSIFVQSWDSKTPNNNLFSKAVGKIKVNNWYKLGIEYNFATQMVSYYLDDVKVGEHQYAITYFDSILFGDHDSDGIDNGNAYFLDDIVLYKR